MALALASHSALIPVDWQAGVQGTLLQFASLNSRHGSVSKNFNKQIYEFFSESAFGLIQS